MCIMMFRELLIHKCICLIEENSFIDIGNKWKNTSRCIIDLSVRTSFLWAGATPACFTLFDNVELPIEWLKSLCNFKANISQFSLIIFGGMLVLGHAFDIFSDRISSHTFFILTMDKWELTLNSKYFLYFLKYWDGTHILQLPY